jgi:hypothetical protein
MNNEKEIMKALQKRRKNGGCSAWRDIGLKWVSDNDEYDLLKYDWEWDYINKHYRKLNEKEIRKLDLDIVDNPFTDDVETNDDELYFDDEDERLDDQDFEDIEKELERLNWKPKQTPLEQFFNENKEAVERSFYCYVISQMDEENIKSYMDGFRTILKDYLYRKDVKKIPKELHKDEVSMDFRKQQIEQNAERLSNQVMEDLFLLMDEPNSTAGGVG